MMKNRSIAHLLRLLFALILIFFPSAALTAAVCGCAAAESQVSDNAKALKLKFIAISSILSAGAVGVLIPILGRSISLLRPEHDVFFVIKAFAAGVILATGLIHILPDAFERLTSPCLPKEPWRQFPFAGFVAMSSAMGTMMVDSFATSYYKRSYFSKAQPLDEGDGDDRTTETAAAEAVALPDVHGGHGHSHGPATVSPGADATLSDRIRRRVISQVLELGIVVHSVIIGVALGASQRASTISPLVGAVSFHQFFEGIGLGGCIVQANFRAKATVVMAAFFSLTAPVGIALGIAISSGYNENSTTALIVEGIFNAASAGILIYMALVDLLAADFTNPRLQSNGRLQLGAHLALLLGAGFMSLLAKWA